MMMMMMMMMVMDNPVSVIRSSEGQGKNVYKAMKAGNVIDFLRFSVM